MKRSMILAAALLAAGSLTTLPVQFAFAQTAPVQTQEPAPSPTPSPAPAPSPAPTPAAPSTPPAATTADSGTKAEQPKMRRHRHHHRRHHRHWRRGCSGSLSYASQRCRDLKRHYSPADLRNPDLHKNPQLR